MAVRETTAGARALRLGRAATAWAEGARASAAWRDAATAWLAHLALVAVASALAWLSGVPQQTMVGYAHPVTPQVFASYWLHAWDAREYARIAAQGYTLPASAAFWPLLPLLERLAAPLVGGNVALAGFVIANLCALAALALLKRLVAEETGDSALARWVVVLIALSPLAFFLAAGYTESLFLLLATGALYAMRRRRWLLAGVLIAFATLTRGPGILLLVPLTLEAYRRYGPPAIRDWRVAGAFALPIAALGGVALVLSRAYGSPAAAQHAEYAIWGRELDWPWYGVARNLSILLRPAEPLVALRSAFDLAALVLALVLLGALLWLRASSTGAAGRRIPTSFVVWAGASLLLSLSLTLHPIPGDAQSPHFDALFSLPRYLLVVFPLALPAATLCQRSPHARAGILVFSACLGVALTFAWACGLLLA